jgi:hypothetical protein
MQRQQPDETDKFHHTLVAGIINASMTFSINARPQITFNSNAMLTIHNLLIHALVEKIQGDMAVCVDCNLRTAT